MWNAPKEKEKVTKEWESKLTHIDGITSYLDSCLKLESICDMMCSNP